MMAGMGSFNIRGLTELQREMEKLQDPNFTFPDDSHE